MSDRHSRLDDWIRGFWFSVVCASLWGVAAFQRGRVLLRTFDWMEVLWLAYNVTVVALFVIRRRPSAVTLDPLQWAVALLTSFSGLFFETHSRSLPGFGSTGAGLVLAGLILSGTTAIALGRNYDFLPALRGVTTGWLYRVVRHPLYSSALLIRLGYLLSHASLFNTVVFGVTLWLYWCRALFEERIMNQDPAYAHYQHRVRYRFIPGVY